MAILITGGAGYVGRWLAHELAAPAGQRPGDDVVALDLRAPDPAARPPLPPTARFVEADVTDRAALVALTRERPFGAIVHLAGLVTMACERDPDPQLAPVSRISRDWRVSVAAAGRELGWRPAYSIETMVDDLIAIVRNNGG